MATIRQESTSRMSLYLFYHCFFLAGDRFFDQFRHMQFRHVQILKDDSDPASRRTHEGHKQRLRFMMMGIRIHGSFCRIHSSNSNQNVKVRVGKYRREVTGQLRRYSFDKSIKPIFTSLNKTGRPITEHIRKNIGQSTRRKIPRWRLCITIRLEF